MQVFLASHDASLMADIAAELIRDGVDPDRVVVYSMSPDPALRPLELRLEESQSVLVADLAEGRIGEMERRIKARHPDVAVLGTEAEGTPPFP